MKKIKKKIYEVDLYKPIQQYFSCLGYVVHGEVNHCDMVALKGNELIIIELKRTLTVELLIQATKRQRLTDQVYVAIPKPTYSLYSKKWRDICHLLRRLEVGLILVTFDEEGGSVDSKLSPAPFDRMKSMQRSKQKREKLLNEVKERHGDYNVGGSTKTKLITTYKQTCIHIACCLKRYGPLSPKALREKGTGDKTLSVLTKNYYGWFEKISRGTYTISALGKEELRTYPDLVSYYEELLGTNLIS